MWGVGLRIACQRFCFQLSSLLLSLLSSIWGSQCQAQVRAGDFWLHSEEQEIPWGERGETAERKSLNV